MDHIRKNQLCVGELHGSPDEVPKPYRAVDLNRLPCDHRAALQADRAEEAREAEEVVPMKMCDEDLGNSPF